MVTAIVLLNVDRDAVNDIAISLTEINGISEVYSVAGQYDLVVVIRAKNNDRLADVVTSQMLKIEGITKSETLFAFGVQSKHDLERMFSIGFEE